MYIKLTKLDNSPIWINSSFVVTIEPARNRPGSIVVPIGDGLDYDVRESAEEVLALLAGAPESVVVPVQTSSGLTKTPADVSPEGPVEPSAPPPAKPVRKTRARKTKAAVAAAADGAASGAAAETEKPVRRTRARKGEKNEGEGGDAGGGEVGSGDAGGDDGGNDGAVKSEPQGETSVAPLVLSDEAVPPVLTDDQAARLQKMAPGSIRKLQNTLIAQFRISDVEAVLHELESRGFVTLDHDHLVWNAPIPAY